MRKVSRASRAILVLEAPWALDEADAHRTSVLPFIEGIAKLAGDVEVYSGQLRLPDLPLSESTYADQ